MQLANGSYAYTGGRSLDTTLPTVVFIHGAQNDHTVWSLQARWFAHHGFSVLAVDLPGHGRSTGPALTSVEAMAAWLLDLLDEAQVQRALLVGHSMGSLVALEAASRAPAKIIGLAMVGTTYPMKVSGDLLEMARTDEAAAIDMVNIWSHSSLTRPSSAGPGLSMMGSARRLMQRMSALNPAQLFHTDFSACNAYANGEAAAVQVTCPVLFVFGTRDAMTPPRSTRQLTAALPQGRTVQVDAGHQMMAEQPDAVLDALAGFARPLAQGGPLP